MTKLLIGGQERPLAFSYMGFYAYVEEASGQDPIEYFEKFSKKGKKRGVVEHLEDVVIIAFAGLNTACDVNDEDNIPLVKVRKWIRALSADQCAPIINACFEELASKHEQQGEAVTQAASA